MSFLLKLDVERLTAEQAQAVEIACRRRKAWPIRSAPPRRGSTLGHPRHAGPELRMPDRDDSGNELLSDQATWDAPAWKMEPTLLPSFAEAIRVLGEELPQGFTLRAI